MSFTLLGLFDLIGTIAFAISGAAVAIRKKMDIFGVNALAVTTACGGGFLRDLTIGNIPPNMFKNPFYVIIAVIVANIVFLFAYFHAKMSGIVSKIYDLVLFWFDTLGLAAFAVDGVAVGIHAGYRVDTHTFLLVFLGFLTGVGGGAIRDIMAAQMPDIFIKHIYALAAIAGALMTVAMVDIGIDLKAAMVLGFVLVIVLRYLAARFSWNLPRVE